MKKNALIFLVLAVSQACFANSGASAIDIKDNCMAQELATCREKLKTTVILVQPGGVEPESCMSSSRVQGYKVSCEHQVQEYCNSFSMLANVNPPEGCAGHKDLEQPPEETPDRPGPSTGQKEGRNAPTPPKPDPAPIHPIGPPSVPQPGPDLASAQADLATCQNSANTASSCCSNPQSCGGVSGSQAQRELGGQAQQAFQNGDSQGLNAICSQLSQANQDAANSDNGFAGVCMTKHNACENICQQLGSKWKNQLRSCEGDNCDQLGSIVSQFSQQQSSCASLQSSESSLRQQALADANQSGAGSYCSQTLTTPTAQNNPSSEPNPFNQDTGGIQPSSVSPQASPNPSSTDPYSAENIRSTLHCGSGSSLPSCQTASGVAGSNDEAISEGSSSRTSSHAFVPPTTAAGDSTTGGNYSGSNRAQRSKAANTGGGVGASMLAENSSKGNAAGTTANRNTLAKSGDVNTNVLHGEGARSGFEGYKLSRATGTGLHGDGFANESSPDSKKTGEFLRWNGLSLLSYFKQWARNPFRFASKPGTTTLGSVSKERLGLDGEMVIEDPPTLGRATKWKPSSVHTAIGLSAASLITGLLLFMQKKKAVASVLDRRVLPRRQMADRRLQPTAREPSLERRHSSSDRRSHDQRLAQRR